ncbi:MAG: ATP-binding protein [Ginsengibacter sp.]
MMKNFFDKIANRTRIGFLAAFFLLLVAYILTFISTQKVFTQDYWINHTNEVIHSLDNVVGFINKGEAIYRGYIITGDVNQLARYDKSIISTDSCLATLDSLIEDGTHQQKNLDTLHQLIVDKFTRVKRIIYTFSAARKMTPELLEGNKEGTIRSTDIEAHVKKMQEEERGQWLNRSEEASKYNNLVRVLNVISIIIAILLTIYSIIIFNKENKGKEEQSKKAKDFQAQLEKRVEQLADLNKELINLRSLEKYAVTGRIARTIAHEVRNPLTNINLSIEQLRTEVPKSETTGLFFDMVVRNSERINNLVSDLLNTTRVADLNFSKTSINEVLDSAIDFAADRIELKQIKVVKNYDDNICGILVDIQKIKVAFLNIIVNAIEAMDDGGILTISTENINNKCVSKIKDNGKGMTREQLGRLFEPYFTTKEKGNGLGLANSQNIILGHNGSISAESEPGIGTTFTIIFDFT